MATIEYSMCVCVDVDVECREYLVLTILINPNPNLDDASNCGKLLKFDRLTSRWWSNFFFLFNFMLVKSKRHPLLSKSIENENFPEKKTRYFAERYFVHFVEILKFFIRKLPNVKCKFLERTCACTCDVRSILTNRCNCERMENVYFTSCRIINW